MPLLGLDAAADRGHVVADQADDAGGVDEGGLGLVVVDQLDQRRVELLLAAVDHVRLAQVGGKAQAVQFRPGGERAADVPGVGRAADRAVDQVHGVGDRIEHHARAAEHARPLADRAGQALLLAGHGERLGARLVDLRLRASRMSIIGRGSRQCVKHAMSLASTPVPSRPRRFIRLAVIAVAASARSCRAGRVTASFSMPAHRRSCVRETRGPNINSISASSCNLLFFHLLSEFRHMPPNPIRFRIPPPVCRS